MYGTSVQLNSERQQRQKTIKNQILKNCTRNPLCKPILMGLQNKIIRVDVGIEYEIVLLLKRVTSKRYFLLIRRKNLTSGLEKSRRTKVTYATIARYTFALCIEFRDIYPILSYYKYIRLQI